MTSCLSRALAYLSAGISLFLLSFLLPLYSRANIEQSDKYASIVVNASTYEIMQETKADEMRYPASLTKLMTLYLTFRELERGHLHLHQMIKVSKRAASQQQTNIGLHEGEEIPVEDCVEALIVRSANDCAVVLADAISDAEFFFAMEMNKTAKDIGMTNTRFVNANGLPDKRQFTTAADIVKLALAIKRDFPKYYNYFSDTEYFHHGEKFISHNAITKCYIGADGMKTGYINDSGFNIVSAVNRNGKDVIAVVLGGETALERDRKMVEILNQYFPPENGTAWGNIRPVKEEFSPICDKLGMVHDNS